MARPEGRGGLGFPPAAQGYAARLAAEYGLDAAEVPAGAQAVLDRAAVVGATTARGVAAWIAGGDGRDRGRLLDKAVEAVAARRGGRG